MSLSRALLLPNGNLPDTLIYLMNRFKCRPTSLYPKQCRQLPNRWLQSGNGQFSDFGYCRPALRNAVEVEHSAKIGGKHQFCRSQVHRAEMNSLIDYNYRIRFTLLGRGIYWDTYQSGGHKACYSAYFLLNSLRSHLQELQLAPVSPAPHLDSGEWRNPSQIPRDWRHYFSFIRRFNLHQHDNAMEICVSVVRRARVAPIGRNSTLRSV